MQAEVDSLNLLFGFANSTLTKYYDAPNFFFYADQSDPIGARALRGNSRASSIYFGVQLINDELQNNPSYWQTSVIGTMAHEWAHALQYKTNLVERRFFWETHADFLAGWYLGAKTVGGIQGLNQSAFAKFLALRGENLGYFDEDAYGTSQQRVQAMAAGYEWALTRLSQRRLPDVYEAANEGYDIVQSLRS